MDTHLSGYVDQEEIDYHGQERGYYRQIECFLAAVEAQDQNLVRSSYAERRQLPRRHPRRQPLTSFPAKSKQSIRTLLKFGKLRLE